MSFSSIAALAGFIGGCFMAAMSGAFFRPGAWYESLAKPRWNPPNWVFAPAWSVLYFSIAMAGWLVWRKAGFTGAAGALAIYFGSLLINAAWSACFFGLRRIDLGLVNVALLWLSIAATILAFYPLDHNAAFLLMPYLSWVTFAGALNFAIWRLNSKSARA